MKVSPGGVYGVLKRHGLNKLPQNQRKRSIVAVKFLFLKTRPAKRLSVFNTPQLMMLHAPEL